MQIEVALQPGGISVGSPIPVAADAAAFAAANAGSAILAIASVVTDGSACVVSRRDRTVDYSRGFRRLLPLDVAANGWLQAGGRRKFAESGSPDALISCPKILPLQIHNRHRLAPKTLIPRQNAKLVQFVAGIVIQQPGISVSILASD